MTDKQTKILLIEAKNAGSTSMSAALRKVGYLVMVVDTGKDALLWAQENQPDLMIYDATTMRSSGARTCRRLRKILEDIPLIHCRNSSQKERPNAHADYYLLHPFTSRKLLNRVKAMLPVDVMREEIVRCGDITLYRHKRSVAMGDQSESQLTPKQADLLEAFIRHPYQILSRRELMQSVWQTDYLGDTRTLDVHIRWVREHIEKDPAKPSRLLTVRGRGYMFKLTDSSEWAE